MHWKPTNHTGEPPTNPSWSPWLLSIFICYFITCLYISQRWQPVQLNGTVAKWNVMDRHLGPREKWVGCGPPQSILWKNTAEVEIGSSFHAMEQTSKYWRIYHCCKPGSCHTTETSFVARPTDWSIHQEAQEKLNYDIWRPLHYCFGFDRNYCEW